MARQALYTIGYEGAAREDFWATLVMTGVKTLIDVRDVPFSRRPGFSKKAFGEEAGIHCIGYVHLSGLGDPKEGRDAAKAGNHALFLKIFSAHMVSAEAVSDLAKAISLSLDAPACLLCYERNPKNCHRSIVAARMAEHEDFHLHHLGVRAGLAIKAPRTQRNYGAGELALGGI